MPIETTTNGVHIWRDRSLEVQSCNDVESDEAVATFLLDCYRFHFLAVNCSCGVEGGIIIGL